MFGSVLACEFIKLRRSKVTWYTLAALSMGPLGIALFMWIVREPGRAAGMGLLGTKADLSGLEATWASFASMMTLIVGMGGMIVLSFIVAYIFGREYADGTAKNMLGLPVRRVWFVVAKLVVSAVWWATLVVAVLLEALMIGLALRLPGLSAGLIMGALRSSLLSAGIAFLLVPMVAWITIVGRGYMPALGFALAMMALGNVFGKTGWATLFPWSIVPLLIGMVDKPVDSLPLASYLVVAVMFAAGVAATSLQLVHADNTQ